MVVSLCDRLTIDHTLGFQIIARCLPNVVAAPTANGNGYYFAGVGIADVEPVILVLSFQALLVSDCSMLSLGET